MISDDKFANTFGAVAPGDTEQLRKIAILAVRNGFAVVLVKPGDKAPLCPLLARARNQADREARETHKAAGDANWARREHACGIAHAFTDPAEIGKVTARLIKNGMIPNLGVELGRSRMVVVDTDTADQTAAFLAAWEEATGDDMTGMVTTVKSPGSQKPDGTWPHKDGGHFWFYVPDGIELPTNTGVVKGEGDWAVYWRDRQILVPPSKRPEGEYRLRGQATELPPWLREFIESGAKAAGDREPAGEIRNGDAIDRWASDGWDSVLTADGWTKTGRFSECGCPEWTAPGEHASDKSATAHEKGCGRYDTSGGQGPIHIWTDNVPECVADAVAARGKTFSKLTYVAYRDHGGDMDAAKAALGIVSDEADDDDLTEDPAKAAAVAKASRTLPDGFWESRRELRHIRQAAWGWDVSPDACLYGVLTRVASMLPGDLRVVTSRGPLSLNLFAAMIGESSACKSTSAERAAELVPVPDWLTPDEDGGIRYIDLAPMGSGEGVAGAYMGETGAKRRQVRHNVSYYIDEGESLTVLMNKREGATLGQILRTAWRGTTTIGQLNGSAERTRIVNDYALGILVGYQPDTAAPLLDGATKGTPQRFVFVLVDTAGNPDEEPEDPGPLWKPDHLADVLGLITDPAVTDGVPLLGERARTAVTLVGSLRAKVRAELKAEGRKPPARLNGHRIATMVKLSGLLAILSGRTEITEDDWSLAATMWGTSCAVRDVLSAKAAQDAKKVFRDKTEAIAERAVKIEIDKINAIESREVEQVARRLAFTVSEKGPLMSSALRRSLKANRREYYPDAVEYAKARGWLVVLDGEPIGPGDARPQ
ncbi:bifunctional DNA primase/polymerase [Streptomyces sp. GESEQ-35]|uniref:bifunctional DNA primase/polymerase n=1 Tax=Streptomyces sp. GESEQ-35 TaxID=2812657 RepID=UPI001B336E16|nr:bifunctional DNA primase/polymerase [Streptomyces sp. GESEQ-35]